MATTVNGTPVPGLLQSITTAKPVGNQAATPAQNIPAQTNTLPKSQVAAPKASNTTSSTANGTLGDNNPNATAAANASYAASNPNAFSPTPPTLPTLAVQNTQPSATTAPVVPQTPVVSSIPANIYYTPPNQGTTGVSQGGLINNLNTNATSNPLYQAALNKVNNISKEQSDLETEAAKQKSFIQGSPFGLSEQIGSQGILQQLLASKQAALAPEYNAAIAELQGANTSQSNTTSGLSAAASANAPIQSGAYTSPSAPATTGQATSGAQSLNSIVGQRPSASNPNVTEFYNTQNVQGFSNPQDLSNFINTQFPGANTNAANVFQYIQANGNNTGNNSGLNPISNINKTAQDVINNITPYATAVQQGSSVPGFQNLLNEAITAGGGNITALQAQNAVTQSNIQTAGTAATTAGQQLYLAKYPEAANLRQAIDNVDDAGKLAVQNTAGQNINPFSVVPLNSTIAEARRLFSSQGQAAFDSNVTNLKNLVTALNSQNGGTPTSAVDSAIMLINDSTPMGTLQTLINQAKQEGELKFNNSLGAGLKGWNDLQSSGAATQSNSSLKGLF